MVALALEFSFIVAWFLWLHRRQVRDRRRARRVPLRQMRLDFDDEREVGG
jgi:hypothetical protein